MPDAPTDPPAPDAPTDPLITDAPTDPPAPDDPTDPLAPGVTVRDRCPCTQAQGIRGAARSPW